MGSFAGGRREVGGMFVGWAGVGDVGVVVWMERVGGGVYGIVRVVGWEESGRGSGEKGRWVAMVWVNGGKLLRFTGVGSAHVWRVRNGMRVVVRRWGVGRCCEWMWWGVRWGGVGVGWGVVREKRLSEAVGARGVRCVKKRVVEKEVECSQHRGEVWVGCGGSRLWIAGGVERRDGRGNRGVRARLGGWRGRGSEEWGGLGGLACVGGWGEARERQEGGRGERVEVGVASGVVEEKGSGSGERGCEESNGGWVSVTGQVLRVSVYGRERRREGDGWKRVGGPGGRGAKERVEVVEEAWLLAETGWVRGRGGGVGGW
ncbi:hypothetical protein Tco_0541319 [Tanacetum coccineum]